MEMRNFHSSSITFQSQISFLISGVPSLIFLFSNISFFTLGLSIFIVPTYLEINDKINSGNFVCVFCFLSFQITTAHEYNDLRKQINHCRRLRKFFDNFYVILINSQEINSQEINSRLCYISILLKSQGSRSKFRGSP